MIPILILAAGRSSRMGGRDKMLEDVDGLPLLRRQVLMANETGQPVFVALPLGNTARNDAIADLGVAILSVHDADEGLSGTMRGAVRHLPTCDAFMITLGDLVMLQTSDLQSVIHARAAQPDHLIWRGATADGKPGHPIVFDDSLRHGFEGLKGDVGGEDLVKPLAAQTYLVRFADNRARFDLDTPADWNAWRSTRP